jgi:hypothetical protein
MPWSMASVRQLPISLRPHLMPMRKRLSKPRRRPKRLQLRRTLPPLKQHPHRKRVLLLQLRPTLLRPLTLAPSQPMNRRLKMGLLQKQTLPRARLPARQRPWWTASVRWCRPNLLNNSPDLGRLRPPLFG